MKWILCCGVVVLGALFTGTTIREKLASDASLPKRASIAPPTQWVGTYGAWRSSQIGGGGYVQNVVVCPSDAKRLYAYVDVGGVYRSDDGGRSWKMKNRTLRVHSVRSLIVDPRNANRLIAAVGNQWDGGKEGLCVSTDGGETWKTVLSTFFYGNEDYRSAGVLLARDPRNPDIVFAASGKEGVWRSTDNGNTWQKTTGADGLFPTDLKTDRRGKRLLLCAQPSKLWREGQLNGGFFVSEDNGLTWAKQGDSGPLEVAQDNKEPNRWYGLFHDAPIVRVSSDNGITWNDFLQGLPKPEGGGISDTLYDALATGPDFVVLGSRRGTFFRRETGAPTWSKIERQGVTEIYAGEDWYGKMEPGRWQHFGSAMGSVTIDPRNPDRWFFTDWYAIYRTEDAGKHWNLSLDGVEVTVIHCLTQDPGDPDRVHLGMADNGYLQSKNGGERFYTPHINSNMKGIAVSKADPKRVYGVGDPGNGQWRANTIWLSTDGGATWQTSPMTGLPDRETHNLNSIAVSPTNPNLVLVAVSQGIKAGAGGVYRSDDGGKTWRWFGEGLPEGEGFFRHDIWHIGCEVAVDGAGNAMAVSHQTGKVFRRPANAAEWSEVKWPGAFSPHALTADPNTPGTFVVAGTGEQGGVHSTTDSGATWKRLWKDDAVHIAFDATNPKRIVAGLLNGIVYSQDGGLTWKRLDDQLPATERPSVAIAGNRVIVGTNGSGVFWREVSPW